jgi:hypothetical protein
MVNCCAVCGCCSRTDIVREHLEDTLRFVTSAQWQGNKFEFFSSIQQDISNLKSGIGIHPKNLIFHICKTSFRSSFRSIFSSHFKFLTTLCFFILCLALALFWACLSCSVKFDAFHFVYLLVLFSTVFCWEISVVDRIFFNIPRDTEPVISSIQTWNLVSPRYRDTANLKQWRIQTGLYKPVRFSKERKCITFYLHI